MNADVIFVIDKSSSFSSTDWGNIKAFLNHTIQYGSPRGTTRYGIITYNSSATTVLSLNSGVGPNNAPTHVNSMLQGSGTTANLGAAISAAITQFSTYSSSSKKKVLIVIAGGSVSGSPCQYNPRDYDIFSYVIALGTGWYRKNVKCIAMSDNNYQGYISSISSTSSLSSIYQTIELYTCPHQPDIRITEVQPLNTSGSRYVELYNFGQSFTGLNLSFSGLFKGYASSLSVSQGEYIVLFDSDDSSYPNCSSCTCSKLAGNTYSYWCSSAVYVGCGLLTGKSFETIKSTCSAQKTYSTATGWQIQVTYSGTKLDNATYNSDSHWPAITSYYAYEKRQRLYNSNFGSSWAQSCYKWGTPGQSVLSTCSYTCSSTMCSLNGANSCSGSVCACGTGYYSYNFTCNPFPAPTNCTGTVVGSSQDQYEFDIARWDGVHFYSAYYCSSGNTSCTGYNRQTTYGPPVTITGEKNSLVTSAISTQFGTSTVDYSSSVSCSLTTYSPTKSPTPSPTHSVPVISKCNITLNGAKTQYTAYWVKPTYLSNGPNSSSLTGYAIYENGVQVTTSSTPNVLNYTGTWQEGSYFRYGTDNVSVSGIWSTTDITASREKAAATKCSVYTAAPTGIPTAIPTSHPSKTPSSVPTSHPTPGPTYSNVSISRCVVTYTSYTVVDVNWTLPTFTTSTITSSEAFYYLEWTSSGQAVTYFWSADPPQSYYFGSSTPDNTTGKMYMYVSWDVNGVTGQGPKTRCTIKTSSPTAVPTRLPTGVPTSIPTTNPTPHPTDVPTNVPTPCPTYTYETLSSCEVVVGQRDTEGNFTFPLITTSATTPGPNDIQYEFVGSSFTTVYVTQANVAKAAGGSKGYQIIQLKNYDASNTSSFFQMYLSYTNLSCSQTYQQGPVTCTVTTAKPTPAPTPAPTSIPTVAPTYGGVSVGFSKTNLQYCVDLSCNYSSQTPVQLVNEGEYYDFYVERNYAIYPYNITVIYNFSFVNDTIAHDLNFTNETYAYLHTFNTTNISQIVDWKIPNDSYWSKDLHDINTWEGPTYSDLGSWSGVFTIETSQQVGFLPVDIIKESYVPTVVRDYNGEVFLLTLTACSIDNHTATKDDLKCSITYPSQLFVIIKDANVYTTTVTKTTANKSYTSWFWYVIAAIALLLAVIGYFVYKWWVNKKMAEAQVTDVQGDIDAVINEQEHGFGNDLGKDNVQFNPLAQPLSHLQKPANNDWTTSTKANNGELQEKADVRVEKFNVKQEFGPQTVARRGDRM